MSVRASSLGQRRLMLLVALVVASFVLFFPARQLVQQRRHIDVLEQRLVQLRMENQKLERDVKRLSEDEELEVLARTRLGLVRPGERAYFIDPVRPKTTPAPRVPEQPSVWDRGWEWLTSVIRGGD